MRPIIRFPVVAIAAVGFIFATVSLAGCHVRSGRPGAEPEVLRPDEIVDFSTLYKSNCSGCHGANGTGGAAMSLANPIYLAVAGEDVIRSVASKGVAGKLMPAFAISAGGSLTDKQIEIVAKGMIQKWGAPIALASLNPPPYKSLLTGHIEQGHIERGQQDFQRFCSSCHGMNGEGYARPQANVGSAGKIGSIVDPTYLDLVSDQSIRSVIIAGRRDQGMPDWRGDGGAPMSDQQVSDIVAWIVSKRVDSPGQPYAAAP